MQRQDEWVSPCVISPGRLSRARGAEHVYVFVLGHHVAHLHVWVVPRYPGTPREYWGLQLFEWPPRPLATAPDVAVQCTRLRALL